MTLLFLCFIPLSSSILFVSTLDEYFGSWSEEIYPRISCGIEQRRLKKVKKFRGIKGSGEIVAYSIQHRECPILAVYQPWSEWIGVGKCGVMEQRRRKLCSDDTVQFGGDKCLVKVKTAVRWSFQACPYNGRWTAWVPRGKCSEDCGPGIKMYIRECDFVQFGGKKVCPGAREKALPCNLKPCSLTPRVVEADRFGTFRSVVGSISKSISDDSIFFEVETIVPSMVEAVTFARVMMSMTLDDAVREALWHAILAFFVGLFIVIFVYLRCKKKTNRNSNRVKLAFPSLFLLQILLAPFQDLISFINAWFRQDPSHVTVTSEPVTALDDETLQDTHKWIWCMQHHPDIFLKYKDLGVLDAVIDNINVLHRSADDSNPAVAAISELSYMYNNSLDDDEDEISSFVCVDNNQDYNSAEFNDTY